jgi:hypothetical protein
MGIETVYKEGWMEEDDLLPALLCLVPKSVSFSNLWRWKVEEIFN